MPSVLFVTQKPLATEELQGTVLGRQGVQQFSALGLEDAQMMALAVHPELVLVDRDLSRAEELIQRLRADESTRDLSVAAFARGEFEPSEVALLEAGANAVLRLPVDAEWERRLVRLMSVPLRRDARFPVHLRLSDPLLGQAAAVGLALNLSLHGMLIEAHTPISVQERVAFAFRLRQEDREKISGQGRVVRQAGPLLYGVEFERLDHAGAARIQGFVATLPA
jgi:DNA-binding response OmpR family regulator